MLNLLNEFLNLLLLDVRCLLCNILLLDLLGHLHFLHLKLLEQLVILYLKFAYLFVLLAELSLERFIEGSHIVFKLPVFAHFVGIFGLAFLYRGLVVLIC